MLLTAAVIVRVIHVGVLSRGVATVIAATIADTFNAAAAAAVVCAGQQPPVSDRACMRVLVSSITAIT